MPQRPPPSKTALMWSACQATPSVGARTRRSARLRTAPLPSAKPGASRFRIFFLVHKGEIGQGRDQFLVDESIALGPIDHLLGHQRPSIHNACECNQLRSQATWFLQAHVRFLLGDVGMRLCGPGAVPHWTLPRNISPSHTSWPASLWSLDGCTAAGPPGCDSPVCTGRTRPAPT